MLDIVLFALTFPPADLSISPSISQVRSIAMSNIDGFKPNPFWQQMYETQVLDEDVDLKLSDEELELIAATPPQCQTNNINHACTKDSDVFVGGQQIIDFRDINNKGLLKPNKHNALINYIRQQFRSRSIPVGSRKRGISARQIYSRIAEHIRDTAPIQTKHEHGGLKIALTGDFAGVECYLDGQCQY